MALSPKKIFPIGSQIAITEASGAMTLFPSTVVTVTFGDNITVRYQASGYSLTPDEFLDVNGTPYGATVAAANAAWNRAQGATSVRYDDKDLHRLIAAPLINTVKTTGGINLPRAQVTSSNALNLSFTVEPGKVFQLSNIGITCDRPYWIGVTVRKQGGANFNNQYEAPFFILGDKDTKIDLPYNDLLFEGGIVAVTGLPISGTATQDQAYLTMRLTGRARSLYEVDNADYRILVVGDSKPLSSMDPGSFGERYYVNQLARALQAQGKRVSVIDKTMPGASSSDMVRMIKSGALEGIKYDLLLIAYGTNNAATTPSTPILTQFKADLSEAIAHRNRTNPNASILYMTPGVTDKTSLVGNIGAYRTAVNEVAADATLGTPARKVYVCQEHLAFTISTTTKSDRFVSTEALNGQVHYAAFGHDDVFNNQFYSAIKTTDFYLNVLKLNP